MREQYFQVKVSISLDSMPKHVVLTGTPGIGKTTLVRKVHHALQESHLCLKGFYTEEVRENNRRIGFDIVALSGERGKLARARSCGHAHQSPNVGQYSVDLESFERLALPQISSKACDVLIVDEIGKMELFSERFKSAVASLFDQKTTCILTTIPVSRSLPLVEMIRRHQDVKLLTVTKENRDQLLPSILELIKASVDAKT